MSYIFKTSFYWAFIILSKAIVKGIAVDSAFLKLNISTKFSLRMATSLSHYLLHAFLLWLGNWILKIITFTSLLSWNEWSLQQRLLSYWCRRRLPHGECSWNINNVSAGTVEWCRWRTRKTECLPGSSIIYQSWLNLVVTAQDIHRSW